MERTIAVLLIAAAACLAGCMKPITTCAPTSCEHLGATCGKVPDGCGAVLECGSCGAGQTCGGGGAANVCGMQPCSPTSCEEQRKNCGAIRDGCGDVLDCGSCSAGVACEANLCQGTCVAESGAELCAAAVRSCGAATAIDSCGVARALSCGGCPEGQHCDETGLCATDVLECESGWLACGGQCAQCPAGANAVACQGSQCVLATSCAGGLVRCANGCCHPWALSAVEAIGSGSTLKSSLRMDAAGNPHVAYAGGARTSTLQYARWSGTEWVIEAVVDGSASGASYDDPALALDDTGVAHILFVEINGETLKARVRCAHRSGASWTLEDVGEEAFALRGTSLAAGSDDTLHASFVSEDTAMYARRPASGGWELQTVGTDASEPTQLVLDAAGNPRIGMAVGSSDGVVVASWNGAIWLRDTVDTHATRQFSLAIDRAGDLHVSYHVSPSLLTGELWYARKSSGTWSKRALETAGDFGAHSSIAVGADGLVHLAYTEWTSPSNYWLRYGSLAGATWYPEVVDDVGSIGPASELSIALDAAGSPRMTYFDAHVGTLKYARLAP